MNRCITTGVLHFHLQGEMFPLDLILWVFFHVVNQLSFPRYGKVHPFPTDLPCYLSLCIHTDFHALFRISLVHSCLSWHQHHAMSLLL